MIIEFKAFVMKGNIIDLAVIIGAAFKSIVTSFVSDILMPPIGVLLGGADFTDLVFVLIQATEGADEVVISYGKFIQTIIDFLINAFVVFMVIKGYNATQRKREEVAQAAPPAPSNEEILLGEIRDLLKEKK
ncbi:MAG: large conductance mechanosensitive channel [Marinoscillum sp.]|jgi:large conductance mechanosensitive channel